jgi:tRNA pseudouridine55 synthase
VLVDKPAGLTSHDAVHRVRRALGIRSAGHTGTLDPFATGLLVVLLGRATRLARFVESQAKTYLATARLGIRTDTDDRTGRTLEPLASVSGVSESAVREALAEFVGVRRQRPPSFSAKHVQGVRSYRLARRGTAVELPEVAVTVHRIETVAFDRETVTFRATVSAGTYLRAIARDLGDRLGIGAHLVELRREAIGAISVDRAVPLDQVSAADVRPARYVLGHLPAVDLDERGRRDVLHGRVVRAETLPLGGSGADVALLWAGELVAVAREVEGLLKPAVVLGEP